VVFAGVLNGFRCLACGLKFPGTIPALDQAPAFTLLALILTIGLTVLSLKNIDNYFVKRADFLMRKNWKIFSKYNLFTGNTNAPNFGSRYYEIMVSTVKTCKITR